MVGKDVPPARATPLEDGLKFRGPVPLSGERLLFFLVAGRGLPASTDVHYLPILKWVVRWPGRLLNNIPKLVNGLAVDIMP